MKLSLINLKKEVIGDIRIRHNKKDIESIIAIAKENINKILNNKEISIDKLLGNWYFYSRDSRFRRRNNKKLLFIRS